MPLVIVGHGSGAALLLRLDGLSTVESLDLALFINTEHDIPGQLRSNYDV